MNIHALSSEIVFNFFLVNREYLSMSTIVLHPYVGGIVLL